jgi:hypothetical protein
MFALLLAATMCSQSAPSREQIAFKEWATMVRQTRESAATMKNRKQSWKDSWIARKTAEREIDLCRKYKIQPERLYPIFKQAVLLKWAVKNPADRKAAQSILDPLILEDEIDQWVEQHKPPFRPRTVGVAEAHELMTESIYKYAEIRKRVPITVCTFKRPGEGQPCGRKTVGGPGTSCYDHRAPKP